MNEVTNSTTREDVAKFAAYCIGSTHGDDSALVDAVRTACLTDERVFRNFEREYADYRASQPGPRGDGNDADKFERLLTELMALDERHHLGILLSAAQDLVSAIEQNLAGQPTTGEEKEVAFCLSQLDAAKGMLIHRQDTMHELRYSRSPDCCSDVIPF